MPLNVADVRNPFLTVQYSREDAMLKTEFENFIIFRDYPTDLSYVQDFLVDLPVGLNCRKAVFMELQL